MRSWLIPMSSTPTDAEHLLGILRGGNWRPFIVFPSEQTARCHRGESVHLYRLGSGMGCEGTGRWFKTRLIGYLGMGSRNLPHEQPDSKVDRHPVAFFQFIFPGITAKDKSDQVRAAAVAAGNDRLAGPESVRSCVELGGLGV